MKFNLNQADASCDDGVGKAYFFTWEPKDKIPGFICSRCGNTEPVVMRYSSLLANNLKLMGIDFPHKTLIIQDTSKPLGVTCGCYAKFQRQIVHIKKGRERR